ncbi:5-formyltetrahydrofolate cyclo-ligase [Bartonella sp. B10]
MSDISEYPQSPFSIRSHLRQLGLSQRDALSARKRDIFSHRACTHLLHYFEQIVEDFSCMILAGYWPIKSEIDPRPLFNAITLRGGILALPAILDSKTMVFRSFSDSTVLEPMRFGTFGPSPEDAIIVPNFIIVPLSAFDSDCHRLGYGGGYYDRTVASLTKQGYQTHLLGLGFSCQKVDNIPHAEHDLIVSKIFTEEGFIEARM